LKELQAGNRIELLGQKPGRVFLAMVKSQQENYLVIDTSWHEYYLTMVIRQQGYYLAMDATQKENYLAMVKG
jgi:hypothetical protein